VRLPRQVLGSLIWAWAERQRSLWVRVKGMAPSKRGEMCPHPSTDLRLGEWWQRGSAQPRGGDTALSSQSHCQAEEEEGPRPQNHLLPSVPSCLSLGDAERREQMEGREAGPVAVRRGLSYSKRCPLPLPEAGRLPQSSRWPGFCGKGSRPPWETPAQGGRCK